MDPVREEAVTHMFAVQDPSGGGATTAAADWGLRPVELQCIIDFEEMIVAADLNGTVACVPYDQCEGATPQVRLDGLRFQQIFARFHRLLSLIESGRVP